MLDREKGSGTVEITVDTAAIDFGHEKLNEHAKGPKMLDIAKYSTATYKGTMTNFKDGAPRRRTASSSSTASPSL